MKAIRILPILTVLPAFLLLFLTGCHKTDADYIPLSAMTSTDLAYGSDPSQTYDLYLPGNRSPETKVILMIHGGAWVSGDKSYCKYYAQYLCQRGYAAVSMNYRLAVSQARYGDMLDDISSMLHTISANAAGWGIRGDRVTLFGQSAGGHLALLYAYSRNQENTIPAVISLSGPTDLQDSLLLSNSGLRYDIRLLTGDTVPEHWAPASPVSWVSGQNPPTLLFHGTNDSLVPVSQATSLDLRSRQAGAHDRVIILENEEHIFSYEGFLTVIAETDLFLQEMVMAR